MTPQLVGTGAHTKASCSSTALNSDTGREAAAEAPDAPPADLWRGEPRPKRLHRVVLTLLPVAICAVLGLFLFSVDAITFSSARPDAGGALIAAHQDVWIAASFWLGVLSLILLPVGLRAARLLPPHPTQSGSGTAAAATVRALSPATRIFGVVGIAAGFVITAATTVSSAALPAALAVSATMVTRRHWGIAIVDLALIAVSGLAFALLSSATAGDLWFTIATLVATIVAVAAVGLWQGNLIEQRQLLAARARLTQVEANAMAERARLTERTAIARDMHDTLSHRLSLISMHAGALEYRNDLDSDQVRHEAGTIATSARQAADDLRAVLTILRQDTGTSPGLSLDELIIQAHHAQQAVDLAWEPPLDDSAFGHLPTAVAHTVYRAVQESLTNARKHAPGQPVRISLAKTATGIRITINNPTTGSAPQQPQQPHATAPDESGYGLVGLSERVRLLGGALSVVQPAADRQEFSLIIDLPTAVRAQ